MKKLIPLILAGAMLLGAAGCSNNEAADSEAPASAPATSTAPTSEEPGTGAPDYSDIKIGVIAGLCVGLGIAILFCPPFSLFWRFIVMLAGE